MNPTSDSTSPEGGVGVQVQQSTLPTESIATGPHPTPQYYADPTAAVPVAPPLLHLTTTVTAIAVPALTPHRTRLPNALYIFSFCPPICSPLRHPKKFFAHASVLYLVGFVAAIVAGLGLPALDLIYGYYTNRITYVGATPHDIKATAQYFGWVTTVVGVAYLLLTWLFLTCFSAAAHDLTSRMRHAYVASVLAQDASHFDLHGPGEIANRANKDITSIRAGFGEKLGYSIWSLSTLIASVIIGFTKAPRFTGVLVCLVPITVIVFFFLGWATEVVGTPALRYEAQSSTFLEQVLSSVRIVQSFGMETKLVERLDQAMFRPLHRLGIRKAGIRGVELGIVYFMISVSYSLAFWWGSINIARGYSSVGSILTSFWNVMNTLFALANMVPHIAAIFDSWIVLHAVRRAIERQPTIDIRDTRGVKLYDNHWQPSFEIQNVTFAYPSRPTVASLANVSIRFEAAKVTALVGPSGSGKSTITSLLLREYDPETANILHPHDLEDKAKAQEKEEKEKKKDEEKKQGKEKKESKEKDLLDTQKDDPDMDLESSAAAVPEKEKEPVKGAGLVLFADCDIRQYNLGWLRSQIAIVQQNPQLFTASIFENVAAGLTGTEWAYSPDVDGNPDASDDIKARTALIREKVKNALEKAQAWTFVHKLPQSMDTVVSGGRTGLLSGGQRQRVAIARALVREPRVLCLDEATSALDSDTEARIKIALQKEQQERGMTTILIAHRLSTIEHADQIYVLKKGKVVETGIHDTLMVKGETEGTYRRMVLQQKHIDEYECEDDNEDEAGNKKPNTASLEPGQQNLKDETHSNDSDKARALARDTLSDGGTVTRVDEESTNRSPPSAISSGGEDLRRQIQRQNQHTPADHHYHLTHLQVPGRTGVSLGQIEHPAESATTSLVVPQLELERQLSAVGAASVRSARSSSSSSSSSLSCSSISSLSSVPRHLSLSLLKVVWKHRLYFLIGIAGAVASGCSFPIAGWLTGGAIDALSIPNDNAQMRHESNQYSFYFLLLAIANVFIVFLNSFFLELASEEVVRRLKKEGLLALIRQEIGFFDAEDQASGKLAAAVSSHPAYVGAATGLVLSQVLISLVQLAGSILVGLILSWEMTLTCLGPILLMLFSGWLNIAMMEKFEAVAQKPVDRASSYISENVDAIKTVSALGREAETMRMFDERAKADPSRTKYLAFGANGFAVSQAMVLFLSALLFYWGGLLLSQDKVTVKNFYSSFEAVIIGGFAAGRLFTFVPDYERAVNSFRILMSWTHRKPKVATLLVDSLTEIQKQEKQQQHDSNESQEKIDNGYFADGNIEFIDIELRYPQRPQHAALQHLNLMIPAGKSVAFCGTSGSGKSSILSLLQRFYDPCRGTITFGQVDVRRIGLDALRSQMSYVSQDPILYQGSVRWNLLLGSTTPESVTQVQLEKVCADAYILDFIQALPNGFETEIGLKGSQLSGGQKQRICIARALVRNPKILLLDEATSALDAESEVQVQRALDNAAKGRTTITIAHRLSSLRKADTIFVVEDGKIIESGSHHELLRKGGRYRELMEAQL